MALKNNNPDHTLTADEARKGGINSGKTRGEQKTVRQLLNEFMKQDIKSFPQVQGIAKKLGLKSDKSIKDLFTVVCALNTLRQGRIDDLTKIADLLGEGNETHNNGILEELTEYLKDVKQ